MTVPGPQHSDGAAVLLPVKAFAVAKERLRAALPESDREALARSLATGVAAAAAPLPTWVACDDEDVAAWARSVGASVVWTPGRGLNGAVQDSVAHLHAAGASEVIVAHADLPLPDGLADLAGFDGITLVPDRRDDGTNVVCIPSGITFAFSYGAASFRRHLRSAELTRRPVRVIRSTELSWDIDLPVDLRDFAARP